MADERVPTGRVATVVVPFLDPGHLDISSKAVRRVVSDVVYECSERGCFRRVSLGVSVVRLDIADCCWCGADFRGAVLDCDCIDFQGRFEAGGAI